MFTVVNGSFMNVRKTIRQTWWSTYTTAAGEVIPACTIQFAYFNGEAAANIVLLQFRGAEAIKRLSNHFNSEIGFNAIQVSGHLETSRIESTDAKHSYAAVIEAATNATALPGGDIVTTVIVVDTMRSCNQETPIAARERAAVNGAEYQESNDGITFSGVVSVNPAIINDGSKYTFGLSNSRRDPTKTRFSISGSARSGLSFAKLRVEVHGDGRAKLFQRFVAKNNAFAMSGTLVPYYGTENTMSITYGVWVSNFMAVNLGMVEPVGNVVALSTDGGVDTEITVDNAELSVGDWEAMYTETLAIKPKFNTPDVGDLPF